MVKGFRTLLLLLISCLLLSQGSAGSDIDTSMISVKKYQKFDYLQTKFIGNFHPFFHVNEKAFSGGLLSRDNHIFSIKIKNITTTDPSSSIYCEYSRDDLTWDRNVCEIYNFITQYSPVIYTDWGYWGNRLKSIKSSTDSTNSTFEIIDEENLYGYYMDYYWVDPLNKSNFSKFLQTAVYDKKMGNIINFNYSLVSDSDFQIENEFAYQFVSVSMDYDLDFLQADPYGYIGTLIIFIIFIYLLYKKIKKKLFSEKLLETS